MKKVKLDWEAAEKRRREQVSILTLRFFTLI
jgi:hypothetical protein